MRRPSGFTLIELLVVISIITILAAILFPVFAQAKERARTAMCQSHLRELMSALMMYTQDYDDTLPWIQFLTYADFGPPYGLIHLYSPYVKNNDILMCPSGQAYAYNENLCGPLIVEPKSGCKLPPKYLPYCDCLGQNAPPRAFTGRALADIALPAQTPVAFDGFRYNANPQGYHFIGPNGWGWECADAFRPDRHPNLHSGGANYAFLDGHARYYHPAGGPFSMPVVDLDYDGDGIVGTSGVIR